MTRDRIKKALSVIKEIEEYAHDNEKEFLKYFNLHKCKLIDISFSSDCARICCILEYGQRITDDISIEDFLKWVDSLQ